MLDFKRISEPSERQIDNLYDEYIKYGGFPAVVLAKEELKFIIKL